MNENNRIYYNDTSLSKKEINSIKKKIINDKKKYYTKSNTISNNIKSKYTNNVKTKKVINNIELLPSLSKNINSKFMPKSTNINTNSKSVTEIVSLKDSAGCNINYIYNIEGGPRGFPGEKIEEDPGSGIGLPGSGRPPIVYNIDQDLGTTSDVDFKTINTSSNSYTIDDIKVSSNQWGHLTTLNQALSTTSDVNFNSINGLTNVSGLINDVNTTINNLSSNGLTGLTQLEIEQMKNIDSNTITTSQFEYLGNSNQDIKTTSNVILNNVDTPLYMNVRNYSVTSIPNYTFFGVSGDCKFYNNLYLPLCYPNYNLTIDSDNKINCQTKNYYIPSSSISWKSFPENKYEANTIQDIKTDSEVVFNKLQINSLNFPVSSSILYGGGTQPSTTYETFTTGTPVSNSAEGRECDVSVSGNTYTITLRSDFSSITEKFGMRSKDGFRPTDYDSVEFIFDIKRFYNANIYIGFCKKTTNLSTSSNMNNTGNSNDGFKVISLWHTPDIYLERNPGSGNINTGYNIAYTTSNVELTTKPAYKYTVSNNGDFTIQYRSSPTSSWQNVSSVGTKNIDPNTEWCAMIWDNANQESNMIVECIGIKTTAGSSDTDIVGKIEKDNENLYVHTSNVIKKLQLTTI